MAFISAGEDILARDLWPQGSGVLLQDAHLDAHTVSTGRIVPSELDELADWMFVEVGSDGRRGKVYVKGGGAEEEDSSELVLRVQGIVHEANLTLTGDWDRTEDNAKKAVQRLSLVSGGCSVAFEPQCAALTSIREMVGLMLGISSSSRRPRSKAIVLRRRVFTKVADGATEVGPSVVETGDDPSGVLHDMSSRWRIVSRLRCGIQDEEGDILHLNPLLIRPGDLVDVSVTVAVILKKTPFGRKYEVVFEPCTIVRLWSAGSMKILLSPRESRETPASSVLKPKGKMGEGFCFRGTRGDKTSSGSQFSA
uniref:Ceramide glucosyltransferase (Glucosylceramide synthase) (GCS) (UDP-glucose ceramide glucosyltransferase) (UDP-glucose:N-acylsphingosine D-glucosyltransferase)) n=1 Tax=Ganoderma boninense TaxID=34458 RepID=A0A5K1JVP1_9APHY|nr:Ceramide glucosyltransferase (EC (GLCT-1) (Glucosylceramide synthase) (GCS) (UDP-glucose ceramide glucosyltransferase) (UDP-glucose:N-acylsphingosine D-glucosyltransferase) [Ganoderma boninense]